MAEDKYIVAGFSFKSKSDYLEAKNEYDGVEYMKARTNMNNPANVFSVYKSIVDKKLFNTPVGLSYLYELREYLLKCPEYVAQVEGMYIPVTICDNSKGKGRFGAGKKKETLSRSDVIKNMKKYDIESVYRTRFISAVMVIFVLIVIIFSIVMITKNSKNTNILNYKARLDAEYEEKEDALVQWQNQLQLREEALKEKEKELENEP